MYISYLGICLLYFGRSTAYLAMSVLCLIVFVLYSGMFVFFRTHVLQELAPNHSVEIIFTGGLTILRHVPHGILLEV